MPWLSVVFMCFPSPFLESGMASHCSLCKESQRPGRGEGSRPAGPQGPYCCGSASDSQVSFVRSGLSGESRQPKLTFPAQPCSSQSLVRPLLLNGDIQTRHCRCDKKGKIHTSTKIGRSKAERRARDRIRTPQNQTHAEQSEVRTR